MEAGATGAGSNGIGTSNTWQTVIDGATVRRLSIKSDGGRRLLAVAIKLCSNPP